MKSIRLAAFALLLLPAAAAAQQQGAVQVATADTRAAVPARDSAIVQLERFLQSYPESPLRANALLQLGELLVRRSDERFAVAQRAGTDQAAPDYAPAIARYEELVRRYPNFDRVDVAAYTLGTLYTLSQRHADAARMFQLVANLPESRYHAEALFRLGDAQFELASAARGNERQRLFAQAAQSYERATQAAQRGGDIWFLAQYKLGWSYYNQATRATQQEYRRAVEVFSQLVDEYDRLTPDQQARLGLRGEAIEYMAIAFTQVGGAQAAQQFFASRGGADYQLTVMRRVAASLRDQGDFTRAIEAYEAILQQSPADTQALAIQMDIIDIYQNRMIEPDRAQQARIAFVEQFGPGSPWIQANPQRRDEANAARETVLREAGQYALNRAQSGQRPQFAEAARLYDRYLTEFPQSDSARPVANYYGEALFGQREFLRAGAQFSRAAYGFPQRDTVAFEAGRSAIVAFDSAVARTPTDRAAQDSLFAAVDRMVEAWPQTDVARLALRQKARRASETERWDQMAQALRTYAQRYPNDPYTPTAERQIGDALYRAGQYAEAQQQWDRAQQVAIDRGQRAVADTIQRIRTGAAASFADTLIRRGEYRRAAEEVYVALADRAPQSAQAPDALRDAIETYMLADSAARARNDAAESRRSRERAVELSQRLTTQYPNYRFRRQYQLLRANLLADLGRREDAVTALRELIQAERQFPERADAMVRLATTLDSLGRTREAAQAYADFSAAYPQDNRSADALFNAAVGFVQAGDTTSAARTYGQFAQRFPRDSRAGQARANQVQLLREGGDVAAAETELERLCRQPTAELRDVCAERNARRIFDQAMGLWPEYDALELTIANANQLTRAGVERASRPKQQARTRLQGLLRQVIQTGHPEYLVAATYYLGLVEWEYGNFLRDVRLPGTLPEEERAAAQQGSAQQAEQFYTQAREIWQALLTTARERGIENEPGAQRWLQRTREALEGRVPTTPPTSSATRSAVETEA